MTTPANPSVPGALAADPQAAPAEATLTQRLRMLCAFGIAAAIFGYVGYWAAEPGDPLGPITLLLVRNRFVAMIELVGLAVVAAGLATVIDGGGAGYRAGPLGAAIGLAALSLRGGGLDLLPLSLPREAHGWPLRALIVESWLWLGLVGVGAVVERWVASWSRPPPDRGAGSSIGGPVDSALQIRRAAGALPIVCILAYGLLALLGGDTREGVLKGQVWFSVGAGFYLASMAAVWLVRVESPLWLLPAVALVATAAYVTAAPVGAGEPAWPSARLLLTPIARPSPIEFAALGSIGVLLGHATAVGPPAATAED